MANNSVVYNYDSLGRLINMFFPDGASASVSYDELGNRVTETDVPPPTPPCCSPTVAAFPPVQNGDFINNPMIVQLSTGELVGWGDNTTGALANGVTTATSAPAQKILFNPNSTVPPSDATIADMAFTNANLYILFSNGWVYSAGSNAYGQLGLGDTVTRPYLTRIEYFVTNSIFITKIWACGSYSTTNGGGCAYFRDDGSTPDEGYQLYGVGNNTAGNLGIGTTTNQSTPTNCGLGEMVTAFGMAIACCGTSFTAYVFPTFSTDLIQGSGYNLEGQIGTGVTTNVSTFNIGLMPDDDFLTGIVTAVANGGPSGGNVLALDNVGNVWSAGYNGHGELGQGNTTNLDTFKQISTLSNVVTIGIGGGTNGMAYAITDSGALYTWGYNGQNNLFHDNSTTPVTTPTLATYLPPGTAVSQVFFPNGNNLSTNAQLIVLTTSGELVYAGVANGQEGIANTVYPGAYFYIPTPADFLDGDESIQDVFVHGNGTTQRWFILSNLGNLYASGSNVKSICTGGISSDTMAANVEWSRISFT